MNITPENFAKTYLSKLSELASQNPKDYIDSYRSNRDQSDQGNLKKWTDKIIHIAEDTIRCIANDPIEYTVDPEPKTQREYYRIDLIGWTGEKANWDLEIAYEHENNPDTWEDELCKLCFVAPRDLRVLASYHKFYEDSTVLPTLKDKIKNLGNKIFRTDTPWLFIFGPSAIGPTSYEEAYNYPFEAFQLDPVEYKNGKSIDSCLSQIDNIPDIKPGDWK